MRNRESAAFNASVSRNGPTIGGGNQSWERKSATKWPARLLRTKARFRGTVGAWLQLTTTPRKAPPMNRTAAPCRLPRHQHCSAW